MGPEYIVGGIVLCIIMFTWFMIKGYEDEDI